MREYLKFYIDGQWVDPLALRTLDVENPATEQACGKIALGSAADVDKAVEAARKAFANWSQSSRAQRLDLLQNIAAEYQKRACDMAAAVTQEMGAPASLARNSHVPLGIGHLSVAIDVLKTFAFEEQRGATLIAREPIGVCGLITPWNWPLNQIAVKVFPALATGCTVVLKPSEVAPFSRTDLRRSHARRGSSGRRVQPRAWRWPRRWRGTFLPSRRRHDLLHRLDPRRYRDHQKRRTHRQARCPWSWEARVPGYCSTTRRSPRAWAWALPR